MRDQKISNCRARGTGRRSVEDFTACKRCANYRAPLGMRVVKNKDGLAFTYNCERSRTQSANREVRFQRSDGDIFRVL